MIFGSQSRQPPGIDELTAALGNAALAAIIVPTISARARRLALRVDVSTGRVVLVQPRRASRAAVLRFVATKADWIAAQLKKLPAPVAFSGGAAIPYLGETHILRWAPEAKGGVRRENGEIIVGGRAEHTARRLRDWLRAEARRVLASMVDVMAAGVDRKVVRVCVRDTRSRWGSCSRIGNLSFCWRLVMAPEAVLTYVAAHEVAHLVHPNHGPAFWRTVEAILGKYPADKRLDAASARQWLRRSGAALHRYG